MDALSKLTIGEIAKVEELAGASIDALADDNSPKGKFLAALAFVFQRRKDPKFTWNQALGLSMDEVGEILGDETGTESEGEDQDPLDGSSEPQPEKKTPKKPAKK